MDWTAFWTGFLIIGTLHGLAVVSPGADFAIVLKNSLINQKAGSFTALGIATGVSLHSTYCLLGLITILEQAPRAGQWLKYAGASYLIILGSMAAVSLLKPKSAKQIARATTQLKLKTFFAQGLLCNLLNPKVFLFLTSIYAYAFGLYIPFLGVVTYALMISLTTLLWFYCLAKFICQPSIRRYYQRFSRILEWLFCLLFIGLGVKLLLQAI